MKNLHSSLVSPSNWHRGGLWSFTRLSVVSPPLSPFLHLFSFYILLLLTTPSISLSLPYSLTNSLLADHWLTFWKTLLIDHSRTWVMYNDTRSRKHKRVQGSTADWLKKKKRERIVDFTPTFLQGDHVPQACCHDGKWLTIAIVNHSHTHSLAHTHLSLARSLIRLFIFLLTTPSIFHLTHWLNIVPILLFLDVIRFSNTYSWLRAKTLHYSVRLTEQDECDDTEDLTPLGESPKKQVVSDV